MRDPARQDSSIEAVMDAHLGWVKQHYAQLLSEGPPTGDYTRAMRDALLILVDMRYPGVPDRITERIVAADRDQLLLWTLGLFKRGGLDRLCHTLLEEDL